MKKRIFKVLFISTTIMMSGLSVAVAEPIENRPWWERLLSPTTTSCPPTGCPEPF